MYCTCRTCTTLDLERMMPAMHSGASCGSIPSQIVTWVQIMETLAAAASAPVFMRLPETQLQCQGRLVMAAMSVSPIVPEGWKYAKCNLPACEHCAIQGMSTRDGKLLTCVFTGGSESLPSEVSQESPAQGPVVIRELPSGVSQESPSGVSQESPVAAPVAQHGHEVCAS